MWKNLGEYHDLYLKTDVLLLCDVFEKLISICLKDYGLDPSHYISSLSLSWDAMLKMTSIKLENIDNIDAHLFLEKGMRGGVSYISKRYSKSDKNTNIMYWDANNLCGFSMIPDLPHSSFKFLSKEEINSFDLDSKAIGYILEVDLEHCKKLHDLHSDYPLCLEKIEVRSDICLNIVKTLLIGTILKWVVLKN